MSEGGEGNEGRGSKEERCRVQSDRAPSTVGGLLLDGHQPAGFVMKAFINSTLGLKNSDRPLLGVSL